MKIAKNSVVTLHYTLKNGAGEVLDSSEDGSPLSYLAGHGQIVPGLERELMGQEAGAKLKVVVAPKDGYGEKGNGNVMSVPRSELPPDADLDVGMGMHASTADGHDMLVWIAKIEGDQITLSTEHPLAGQDLHFDVAVKEVRAATKQELQHGHAHGPGDHHH